MTKRTSTIPADLMQHLCETVPGFSKETPAHQRVLAWLAWIGVNKANQHSRYPDAMSFSKKYLDEQFGCNKFPEINRRLNFFSRSAGWSKAKKETRAYWFTTELSEAIRSYLGSHVNSDPVELVQADGKKLKTVPPPVESKDKCGVTTKAWPKTTALNIVPVNCEELQRLRAELTRDLEAHRAEMTAEGKTPSPGAAEIERCVDTIGKVLILANTKVAGPGVMAHHYQEAESGRIYPTGGISLASVPGLVKEAALRGYWEYDISNCHFTLVAQMAAQHGQTCSAIEHYLSNKGSVREMIAREAVIRIDQVKTCLLALLYGASTSTWHEAAIAKEIGGEAAERLIKVELFGALARDVGLARRVVLANSDRTERGWLKNAFGKRIALTATAAQQFAHLLQGVEAKALQSVIKSEPENIILAQHDGFVSKKRLEIRALEAEVRDQTGYDLRWEERQLMPDPARYFDARW